MTGPVTTGPVMTGPTSISETNDARGPSPSTPAQARLYQRLRGDLAALKLDTAAEALPAVLDTAIAEKLSLTATPQRLLASRSTPPRPAGSPDGSASPACPPPRPWRSSTTTPNPPLTAP
jgi:hypothetical protein